jgi:K+-sensing histidine kinase KdpD
VTAWWDWRWASLSIAIAVVAGKYFFVSPLHSWHVQAASDRWLLALFVGEASLIAWLVARLEAARHIAAHAVALRDRFVATVSHDLRSPLPDHPGLDAHAACAFGRRWGASSAGPSAPSSAPSRNSST